MKCRKPVYCCNATCKIGCVMLLLLLMLIMMMMMMMMMMMSCVMKWWVRQRLCWRCIRRRDSSSDQRWAHVESAQVGREAWECDQEARPLWDVWRAGTLKERQAPQTAKSIEGIGLALQLRDFLCPVFRFGQTMQQCMHLWLSCLMWDKTSVSSDKPLCVKRLGKRILSNLML